MRLLRAYPGAWRTRYGQELAALVEELDASGRLTWVMRLDVVRAGLLERVRLGGVPPRERGREGTLLVVYAWALFVLAGCAVKKASEHWTNATQPIHRGVPTVAFDTLVVTSVVGSLLVMVGVALALPALYACVRCGGWHTIRTPIVRALVVSMLLVGVTVGLAAWAHSLTPAARNGENHLYSAGFLAWALLFAGGLFSWAAAATATARRLTLSDRLLNVERLLATAVFASMVVMTIATSVWWGALASVAPSFASLSEPNIAIPASLMLVATLLALAGVTCTRRAASPSL